MISNHWSSSSRGAAAFGKPDAHPLWTSPSNQTRVHTRMGRDIRLPEADDTKHHLARKELSSHLPVIGAEAVGVLEPP